MNLSTNVHRPHVIDDYLLTWGEAFLVAKKAQGVSKGTLSFYVEKLKHFTDYAETQAVKRVSEITPAFIREYLLFLEDGHNPGGIHAHYRVLKTFLLWFELEVEPENWRNPVKKVKSPRIAVQPLEGVPLEDVAMLVKVSNDRDKAILYALLDTGCRAREFLAVNIEDVGASGDILIRRSKSKRPRYVYLGRTARKALRRYLKTRSDNSPALWVTQQGERLSYSGLRGMVARRAKQAGIRTPKLHDFRRAFALNFLRNGGDIFSLQKLLGHKDLTVLRRYLAQTDEDLRAAHRQYSPIDNL